MMLVHRQPLSAPSPLPVSLTDKFASWMEQVSGSERQHRQMDDRRAHIIFHLPPLSFSATPSPLSFRPAFIHRYSQP